MAVTPPGKSQRKVSECFHRSSLEPRSPVGVRTSTCQGCAVQHAPVVCQSWLSDCYMLFSHGFHQGCVQCKLSVTRNDYSKGRCHLDSFPEPHCGCLFVCGIYMIRVPPLSNSTESSLHIQHHYLVGFPNVLRRSCYTALQKALHISRM